MKICNSEWLAINDDWAKRLCKKEEKHCIRNEFQRDRDRILYSRAFRRLSGKTQVFLAGNDDHVRTRLTHTLEVAQIARTIARKLKLNEDLTEAIALGHDIGHTPFGHVGERMLNSIMNGCYIIKDFNCWEEELQDYSGFKHNWQSIRVAVDLEKSMNLTDYTLWGMLNHSSKENKDCKMKNKDKCLFTHEKDKKCTTALGNKTSLSFYKNMEVNDIKLDDQIKGKWSFEGLVVALADEVAQRHHDIEDALEYKIIDKDELYKQLKDIFNFKEYNVVLSDYKKQHEINFKDVEESINKDSLDLYKHKFSKFIVNILTTDIIFNTNNNFSKFIIDNRINDNEIFYN